MVRSTKPISRLRNSLSSSKLNQWYIRSASKTQRKLKLRCRLRKSTRNTDLSIASDSNLESLRELEPLELECIFDNDSEANMHLDSDSSSNSESIRELEQLERNFDNDTVSESISESIPFVNAFQDEVAMTVVAVNSDMPILFDSLAVALMPFLQRRAGGQMTKSAATTAIHRIGQFLEWAHCHLNNGQGLDNEMCKSARTLLIWFMQVISETPHVLEDYINYQSTVIQRNPSTVLNHMDALVQCYNFLQYDGRLTDHCAPLVIDQIFATRFPFFNTRCRRALKKQLKRYK